MYSKLSKQKINRIKEHELFNDIDGILLTKAQNVAYLLGFGVESDVIIFIPHENLKTHDDRIIVFLNVLEYDEAKKNMEKNDYLKDNIDIKLIPPIKPNFVAETLNDLNLKKIGYEEDYISVKTYTDWNKKLKDVLLIGVSEIFKQARQIKTNDEIDRMKKAARLGEIGFQTIYETIQEGMTEKELAAEAEYAMRKAGSDGTSFDTIVASGLNSAYHHAKTSEKRIENGELIIVDIGAKYNCYCSDMTRTFIFGDGNQQQKDLINLVTDGQNFTLNNIEAGKKCRDIDTLTRNYFIEKKKEWSDRFIHSLGHGVGIDIHENPYLSQTSTELLEENMVITIEPGLYIPGLGGCRIEDQIVVKKDGFQLLTSSEKYYY